MYDVLNEKILHTVIIKNHISLSTMVVVIDYLKIVSFSLRYNETKEDGDRSGTVCKKIKDRDI